MTRDRKKKMDAQFFQIFVCLFFLVGTFKVTIAQNFNSHVEAGIVVNDSENNILKIIGMAKNLTEANSSLRYELSVTILNEANKNSSKNSQSGRFTINPLENKILSQTSVLFHPKNITRIELIIYDENNDIIGTARKEYP